VVVFTSLWLLFFGANLAPSVEAKYQRKFHDYQASMDIL
jgi:hypothetical protein